MTLAEAHAALDASDGPVGVVYRPLDGSPVEQGVISSVNNRFVFVLYGDNLTPKATAAELLTFLAAS